MLIFDDKFLNRLGIMGIVWLSYKRYVDDIEVILLQSNKDGITAKTL